MHLRKLIIMFMLIVLIQNHFGYGLVYLSETIPLRLLSFRLTGVISFPFPTALKFPINIYICLYRKIEHPSYASLDYDFALLRLSQAVDFTDSSLFHVFPACWPSSEPTIEGQEVIC